MLKLFEFQFHVRETQGTAPNNTIQTNKTDTHPLINEDHANTPPRPKTLLIACHH